MIAFPFSLEAKLGATMTLSYNKYNGKWIFQNKEKTLDTWKLLFTSK